MTSGEKNAEGLKGFPTPDAAADNDGYLLFLLPSGNDWVGELLGAADALTKPWNFYESGDLLPEEAADLWAQIIAQAPYNLRDATVNAPFWDEESGDDADDTASEIDQTWYGRWEGETFTESLAYVFLTNFLSGLVSPLAAVRFLTIPRAFRVAIKKNPHGAKLLLFLDGGLYAVINGYSIVDQVVEVIVKALPSEGFLAEDVSPLELMIVNSGEHDEAATPDENGDYPAIVVRSRLRESDVIPANMRYNPETDTVQTTPDGGETWNDAEGSDPRRAPSFRRPPRTGTDRRCDAAANMVAWVHSFMDDIIAALTGVGTAGTILSVALNWWSFLFEPVAIIDLIAEVTATIGGLGSSLLSTSFDEETYGLLLCIFLCGCDEDGQVSADGLAVIQSQVAAQLNTTAAIVMGLILGAQGEVGLSNAGAIGSEVGDCGDCSGCGWCYRFNDTHQLADWTPLEWTPGSPLATYSGGEWHSATFTSSGHTVDYIHLRWELGAAATIFDGGIINLVGSCSGGGQGIWINGDGSLFSGTQAWAVGGSWTAGEASVTSIDILVFSIDSGSPDIHFDGIQFSGTDTENPFGDSNC